MKEYVRQPTLGEWNAFLKNCDRVRILNFDLDGSKTPLSSASILKISVTRPLGSIFKNARILRSPNIGGQLYPMFMSASVTELSLSITDNTAVQHLEQLSWDVDALLARMPHVVSLKIEKSSIGPKALEPFLLQLINGYPSITELDVPYKCLGTAVVEAAARLPKLRGLWNQVGWETIYDSANQPAFAPKLNTQSFPVLEDFGFTATIADAVQFLRDPHCPTHTLRGLSLRIILDFRESSNNGVSRLLDTVGDVCPSIDDLRLYMQTTFVSGQKRLSISFEDIVPIFRLSNLQTVFIYNDEPVKMTDDDARQLASSLPHLVTLYLTRHACEPPTLTLRCLFHFARHCSKLSKLELTLDTKEHIHSSSEAATFRSLRSLHLGNSPISDVQHVVQFLARALPAECRLAVMKDEIVEGSIVYRKDTSAAVDRSWKEVQDSLLRIAETKEGWVDTERSLLNEIDRLKKENQVLKEKLAQGLKKDEEPVA